MNDAPVDTTRALQNMTYEFSWFQLSSDVAFYVALAIGFFIIFIAYFFGGGKSNKMRLFISITVGSVIAILTLPLLLRVGGNAVNNNPFLVTILIIFDIVFATTVSTHLYELIVVRAGEAWNDDRTS